jgi:hypothetical protein
MRARDWLASGAGKSDHDFRREKGKKQIGAALQLKPETREFIEDKARSR